MKLVFVRHAETTANAEGRLQGHADYELSPAGWDQAAKLHERLEQEGLSPTHAYSSPLKRCAQTADVLSRSWPVDITYWDDLKEYDVGIVSGMTWDEIAVRHPHIDREIEDSRQLAGVEGAEPLADRRARGQRVVDALLGRHADGDVVVVVTHGGILQQILAALMGTDRTWGMSIHNTAVYDFDIDLERWGRDGDGLLSTAFWRINRFNDASHLD